jgi:sugar lactone lactonase YvrE
MIKQRMINEYLPAEPCDLGEGPLWHPIRQSLFWFDINAFKIHNWHEGKLETWVFSEPVSAAGWIDEDNLIVASASALIKLSLSTGNKDTLVKLEGDMPQNRSNDGRADPWGGFWVGTMGLKAEPNSGSIYRFYKGELRKLHQNITIPNSICFPQIKALGILLIQGKRKYGSRNLIQQLDGLLMILLFLLILKLKTYIRMDLCAIVKVIYGMLNLVHLG